MTTPNLGGRSANARYTLLSRVEALELAAARIPSRYLNGRVGYVSQIVTQSAHGFAVGDWIGLTGSTWAKAAAASTFTFKAIGIVRLVIDADYVEVVLQGMVRIPSYTLADWAAWYLSTTPGTVVSTAPAKPTWRIPVAQSFVYNWIYLNGYPWTGANQERLSDLNDVDATTVAAPSNQDLLTFDTPSGTWKAASVAVALGTRLALSVIGRSANSAGAAADIQATTTGQVLQMGASSLQWGLLGTASYADLSVTTAKLSATISAGSAGSSSSIPVLTWGVDGRLTSVTTVAVGGASMATLTDATITSPADLDFVRYDSGTSKWKNTSLGRMTWTAASSEFALDGGSAASALSVVGIGKTGSRFMLGNQVTALDFLLAGSVVGGTDVSARIRAVSASQVSFYDQGGPTYTTGTEVLRWNTSSSAGSRSFDFLVPVTSVNIGLVARIRKNGNQSLVANTDTTIDTWSSLGTPTLTGLNTTTGIFTAPAAGTYIATASLLGHIANGVSLFLYAYVSKNASTTDISGKNLSINPTADPFGNSTWSAVSGVFELAAGDTLRLVGNIFTGTTPVITDAYFSVARII